MKLHRFIGDFYLNTEELTLTDSELLNQWKNVLRLSIGSTVILADGKGHEADGTITSLTKKQVVVSIKNVRQEIREPQKGATLYTALIRPQNFELICQKATELGISSIVPLITERTVKKGFNRTRLEKIIKEASEQSGRTTLPSLFEPMYFDEALQKINPKETALFDLSGVSTRTYNLEPLTSFFVGPEGGFTFEEVTYAKEKGVAILSLGTLTLRAETAGIVVSFLATR